MTNSFFRAWEKLLQHNAYGKTCVVRDDGWTGITPVLYYIKIDGVYSIFDDI